LYIWSGNNKKYKCVYHVRGIKKIAERTRAREEKIAPIKIGGDAERWRKKWE